MTFFARLREIMADRRVTKSQVARALGITPQAVGQWGKEGGTMPIGDRLAVIAEILDVSVPELMSEAGSPFRKRGTSLPVRAPKRTRLVNQPDQLALLDFWDDLETEEERMRVFRILRAAVGSGEKGP